MEATLVDIQSVFEEHDLQLPKLNVLTPDSKLYDVLAIQPTGEIETNATFIGHTNRTVAEVKFSEFLRLALDKNCDLALSPEYSCPWHVLEAAIAQHSLPKMGKMWILGCESITRDQLHQFIVKHQDIVWITGDIPSGAGQFLDVLAYVTKAKSTAGDVKDVITLQFKTTPMGGNDTFERTHLVCGNLIYYWHNPTDVIRLVSLICSDALEFDEAARAKCGFAIHPYIIFHAQLIQNPRHPDISAYRGQLFSQDVSKEIEILALNWARGFTLPDEEPSQYGGSAIYTKSPQFDTADNRLEANHQKGLYYAHWYARRTELCLLSLNEHVFSFRMPKIRHNGPASSSQRTGPEMCSLLQWDCEKETWLDSCNPDDGFAELCESFAEPTCDYCLASSHTAVDRERLFVISAGKLLASKDWHKVGLLASYKAELDECSKRITFTHEQAITSHDFRIRCLERYIKLRMTVLTNPANFPPNIQDLSNDWRLHPPHDENGFRFNLVSPSTNKTGATVIFVGVTPPDLVQQLKGDIIRGWGKDLSQRLVIWYEHGGTILSTHPPLPTISDDSEMPGSIVSPVIT